MEAKLAKNRHKGDREGWLKDNPWSLVERILDETVELQQCFSTDGAGAGVWLLKTPEETADECADIAELLHDGCRPNPFRKKAKMITERVRFIVQYKSIFDSVGEWQDFEDEYRTVQEASAAATCLKTVNPLVRVIKRTMTEIEQNQNL